jgi:hypothetical protein
MKRRFGFKFCMEDYFYGFLDQIWLSLPVASRIAAETQFVGWSFSSAFTYCRELMKSLGKLW